MQEKHNTVFLLLIVFVTLSAVTACGLRQTALVASDEVSGEPVPLWSAVTDKSSFACHMKSKPVLEIPQLTLAFSKADVKIEKIKEKVGFDPFHDIKESIATDYEQGSVILLRYEEKHDLIDAASALSSILKKVMVLPDLKDAKIHGRRALINEKAILIQIDPYTIALCDPSRWNKPSEQAAEWLSQMSRQSEKRRRIVKHLDRLAKDAEMKGKEQAMAVYMEDPTALEMNSMVESADDISSIAMLVSVGKAVGIAGEVEFRSEESAKKYLGIGAEFLKACMSLMPFLSDMIHRVSENVKMDIHGSTMKVKTVIPDDGKIEFGFKIELDLKNLMPADSYIDSGESL